MLKNIKVVLEVAELVLSIGAIVTKAGRELADLFDKNSEN